MQVGRARIKLHNFSRVCNRKRFIEGACPKMPTIKYESASLYRF